jgi:TIR domain
MSSAEPERSFDIALSFAGEHRSFVRDLNNRLTELGISVFFDEEYQAEMWGENLYDYLQEVYRTKARFVVAFASETYGTKAWPTLERQSAQSRALSEVGPFLLPVRLDDSELPGILTTIGYVDARIIGLEGLVDLILKKLGKDSARQKDDPIPLTQPEIEVLKNDRPDGWEWYLFAGILVQGKMALEDKWRDHTIGLKLTNAPRLTNRQEAITYVKSALDQVKTIVGNLDRIISLEMQEEAFGPTGTHGDWDLDVYMGSRFVGLYEQLLSWAAEVRSANVPDDWVRCFEILSTYCDQPIDAVRASIDKFAEFARSIPAHLEDPDAPQLRVDIPLKFELDPATAAAFSAEMQRLSGN